MPESAGFRNDEKHAAFDCGWIRLEKPVGKAVKIVLVQTFELGLVR